jgi:hypothetical protein
MDFGDDYRILGRVEIGALVEKVLSVEPSLWDAEEATRRTLAGDRPTRSIFIYNATTAFDMPRDRRVRQDDIPQGAGWAAFHALVQPILDQLLANYPPGGTVFRCQIANLIPGGVITRHMDVQPLLRLSHRIHVPLVTWPEVRFVIDGKPLQTEAGLAFELNNQKYHEVENGSPHDRHHLIFDYLPPDYDLRPIQYVQKHGRAPPVWPMPATMEI